MSPKQTESYCLTNCNLGCGQDWVYISDYISIWNQNPYSQFLPNEVSMLPSYLLGDKILVPEIRGFPPTSSGYLIWSHWLTPWTSPSGPGSRHFSTWAESSALIPGQAYWLGVPLVRNNSWGWVQGPSSVCWNVASLHQVMPQVSLSGPAYVAESHQLPSEGWYEICILSLRKALLGSNNVFILRVQTPGIAIFQINFRKEELLQGYWEDEGLGALCTQLPSHVPTAPTVLLRIVDQQCPVLSEH